MSVQFPSRQMIQQLSELQPTLRRGAHVLYVGDPYPKESYILLFTTSLFYRDLSIAVDRAAGFKPGYDAVFGFRDGRLIPVTTP
jgi:hypothetical protein